MARAPALILATIAMLFVVACDDSSEPASATATSAGPPVTSTPDESGVSRDPITPVVAGEGGRSDCPADWLVHTDTAFTVCYPPDYYAHTWSSSVFESRFSLRLIPGEPLAHTPNALNLWFTSSYDELDECTFQEEAVVPDAETELMAYELASSNGVVCLARTSYAIQFKGSVPAPPGALNFHVHALDDEILGLAMSVLETVQAR